MAGSIAVTASRVTGYHLNKYRIEWTSDASGNVSANTLDVVSGHLRQVKFIPGSGATQPTDLYDVTLTDADGVDLLAGLGANLSNAAARFLVPQASTFDRIFVEAGTITPGVANAGNAKTGSIILLIGP